LHRTTPTAAYRPGAATPLRREQALQARPAELETVVRHLQQGQGAK
jgi:hypothetical protein